MLKTTKKYETNTDNNINTTNVVTNNNIIESNNIKNNVKTNTNSNNITTNNNFCVVNKLNTRIEIDEINKIDETNEINKVKETNKPNIKINKIDEIDEINETDEINKINETNIEVETEINKISSSVLSKYMNVFNTFINYDNKSFELNVLLNKCIYDFNYKYLFEYLVYNIKSTFLFTKDTMYLMFLLNKNMNIVFKYLINSLLFIGLSFILLLVLSILTLVYMLIGTVSCILFIITYPFKFIHKLLLLLLKKNKKDNDDNDDNDKDNDDDNNKDNNNKNNIKRNIEQEIILNITGNKKGKKLSRIKIIILKLLNKVNTIFNKLNKQLQIKFIDKKVTNYNKHTTKKMKSRTKVISNSLGIKDNSKERINSKYQVVKKLSSMIKNNDKSSYFKPKEKLEIK